MMLSPWFGLSPLSPLSGLLAFSAAIAIGCATHDDATPEPSDLVDLGLACDSAHPCPSGTTCGACGIGTGQCVAPCSASGTAGCPTGSFCSAAWSGDTTHICVRTCIADADCQAATHNAGLSCNDPYADPGTTANGVSICNVSNSIASANTCP